MPEWSDSRVRGIKYKGISMESAIEKYYSDRNEEEMLALRWDNEYLRKERDRQTEKVRVAKANG